MGRKIFSLCTSENWIQCILYTQSAFKLRYVLQFTHDITL